MKLSAFPRFVAFSCAVSALGFIQAKAQAIFGDNFDDNTANPSLWSADFVAEGDASSFVAQNGRLEFIATLPQPDSFSILFKDGLIGLPVNQSWVVTADVFNTSSNSDPSVRLGIWASSPDFQHAVGIYLKADSGGHRVQDADHTDIFYSGVAGAGTLKIAFNALTQEFDLAFANGIGASFVSYSQISMASWGLSATDNFILSLAGEAYSSIPSGEAYLDNLAATAVPEPSAYAAMAGTAALGLIMWRKRRQARA